jgi:ABC-type transport system involved in multi-copper enzyme maturation permease subunit
MRRVWTVARLVWLEMLRRKDLYVMAVLLGVLLYGLLAVNVFDLGGNARYVTDLGLALTWLFSLILAVNVGCRQLPREEERRTIYPLLAKPLTRGELIIGKWLGSWGICLAATAVFYGLVAAVSKARGSSLDAATWAQAFALQSFFLAALAAMGIAFSTRMTAAAAGTMSYTVTAASLLLLPRMPEYIALDRGTGAAVMEAVYYSLPHFELFDMRMRVVHEWGTLPASVFALLAAYGAVLTMLLLFLAWLAYRTKRFLRGGSV